MIFEEKARCRLWDHGIPRSRDPGKFFGGNYIDFKNLKIIIISLFLEELRWHCPLKSTGSFPSAFPLTK